MNGLRLNVEYVVLSIGAPALGLLHDERGGVAFVEEAQFAVWGEGVVGVKEDAAVHQGAVEVGDEGADVSEKDIEVKNPHCNCLSLTCPYSDN